MTSFKNKLITKASGQRTFFDEGKLRFSLKKSGADARTVDLAVEHVKSRFYEGISTGEIYHLAFTFLRDKVQDYHAAKYKLKNVIMELGPSGFPFEKFVAALLNHQGFETSVSVILQGKCVSHEIDIVARHSNQLALVECKYHNNRGTLTDVKVPLYINSRFEDVRAVQASLPENEGKELRGWLVTNTHFSEDAITYGNCAGLQLVGWDYPTGGSLKEQIDKSGLYPITCLTTLTKSEKIELLDKNVVLCKELLATPVHLSGIGIIKARIRKILTEATHLSGK